MRDTPPELIAFATLLKQARKALGVSVDDVIKNTSVTRSTYFRWEAAEVAITNLPQVREVCVYLRIPLTSAGIALGLLVPEDLPADPAILEIDAVLSGQTPEVGFRAAILRALKDAPVIVSICRAMANTAAPGARAALVHALDGALNMWKTAVAMDPPKEPSRAELGRRARTAR